MARFCAGPADEPVVTVITRSSRRVTQPGDPWCCMIRVVNCASKTSLVRPRASPAPPLISCASFVSPRSTAAYPS